MRFKISDKIITKGEILLFREGCKQYFTVSTEKKCFSAAKEVQIGDIIDCLDPLETDVFGPLENFKIIKNKKKKHKF